MRLENKKFDLNRSVYELCKDYPDLPKILYSLGFTDITKPGMLNTAGRFMTLKKGAAMKKISLEKIKDAISQYGYEVTD